MKDKVTHFMSTVKVGPKGQVVIPKEIRDMFVIEPGDNLIMMADSEKGIAIHKQSVIEDIAKAIFEGKGKTIYPEENEENLEGFASAIKDVGKKGESEK